MIDTEANIAKQKPHLKFGLIILIITLILTFTATTVFGALYFQKSETLDLAYSNNNELNNKINEMNDKIASTETLLNEYIEDLSNAVESAKLDSENNVAENLKYQEKIDELASNNAKLEAVINKHKISSADLKECYLTFDDGPSDNTLKILEILDQKSAKATFFVVGTGKLEYIKEIDKKGHAVGLHSNTHDYSKIYKSEKAFFDDINALGGKIENLIGYSPTIIRFPGGASNAVSKKYNSGIMTRLTKSATKKGYTYFDWNVSSGDAEGRPATAQQILKSIKEGTNGKKRICILMHDTASKNSTVEALPAVIDYLRGEGYVFKTLSEVAPVFQHTVSN